MTLRSKTLLPALQLTRFALVYTAVSNSWSTALFSKAFADELPISPEARDLPLWALLLCTALTSGGLYVFGMTLNDVMDARRDRLFAPHRPLPSGRFSPAGAVIVAFIALLTAIAASVPLGHASTLLTLITAAMALVYDAFGKYVPGVGVALLGLIRAGNMLIANPSIAFLWPVWMIGGYIMGLSALCHRLERKRPLFGGGDLWIVVGVWSFFTVMLIGWMSHKQGLVLAGHPWVWVGPVGSIALFLGVMAWTLGGGGAAAGGLLMKRGLMWLMVIDAGWLAAMGLEWQATLPLALLGAAWGTMQFTRHLAETGPKQATGEFRVRP
jgi:hypothetical protein